MSKKKMGLAVKVLIGLAIGFVIGLIVHYWAGIPERNNDVCCSFGICILG